MNESTELDLPSVVFLGRRSFRMQIGSAPAPLPADLAVPAHRSDGPTERLYGPDLQPGSEPGAILPRVRRRASKPLGAYTAVFLVGVLVTSLLDRGLLKPGSERGREEHQLQPGSTPVLSVQAAPPVAPAAPATIPARPRSSASKADPPRSASARSTASQAPRRPIRAGKPDRPGGEGVTPPATAGWVDPFAG